MLLRSNSIWKHYNTGYTLTLSNIIQTKIFLIVEENESKKVLNFSAYVTMATVIRGLALYILPAFLLNFLLFLLTSILPWFLMFQWRRPQPYLGLYEGVTSRLRRFCLLFLFKWLKSGIKAFRTVISINFGFDFKTAYDF